MTHDHDRDFQQFRGAFDDAMIPDAAFKARMAKLLKNEQGQSQSQQAATVIASPSRKPAETVIPTRRSHPLMVAVAVFLVFSVVAASAWFLSEDVREGQYGNAPAGIATMPENAPGTPGPDREMNGSETLVANTDGSGAYTLAVIDGVIYRTHSGPSTESRFDESESFISAWDAATGDFLWKLEGYSVWNLSVTDGVLVGLRTVHNQDYSESVEGITSWPDFRYSLVAFDAETGEPLWEVDLDTPETAPVVEEEVTTAGELVVHVTPEGTIRALDIQTGEVRWESEIDRGKPWSTQYSQGDETIDFDRYSVSITATENYVAVTNGDGVVQIIDPATGSLENSYSIESIEASDGLPPMTLATNALPQGLLINTESVDSTLILTNPSTGEVTWEREFPGSIRLDVAENGMIAINSHIWESGSILMQIFGRGGHNTHQFFWVDGETGEDVLSTERSRSSGPVIAVSNDRYLCIHQEELVCYDRFGTRLTVDASPQNQIWVNNGAIYFDESDGVHRVELP